MYQLGEYLLDPKSRSLSRDGESIDVQGLIFDLHLYMARRPGELLDRDTLLAEIWGHTHRSDASVSQAIRKARAALGDDGTRQAYIQTVHGRGFSLICDVQRLSPSAPVSAPPTRRVWLLAALLAVVTLAVTVYWPRTPETRVGTLRQKLIVSPFENASGDERYGWFEYGLAETTSLLLDQVASKKTYGSVARNRRLGGRLR